MLRLNLSKNEEDTIETLEFENANCINIFGKNFAVIDTITNDILFSGNLNDYYEITTYTY